MDNRRKTRLLSNSIKALLQKKLETLAGYNFVGHYLTTLDCNSKYALNVDLIGVEGKSYYSYVLGLNLYKKDNGLAQHSLKLSFDKTKGNFLGTLYYGYSTPCFRGKLKTNETISFMCDYIEPRELFRLLSEGITKEEHLSAYFDGATSLTDFMNKVLTKANYPHLKVEGLEDD